MIQQNKKNDACHAKSQPLVNYHLRYTSHLCRAINGLQTLKPDIPLKEQLKRLFLSTREAITHLNDAKNTKQTMLAHKRQQKSDKQPFYTMQYMQTKRE